MTLGGDGTVLHLTSLFTEARASLAARGPPGCLSCAPNLATDLTRAGRSPWPAWPPGLPGRQHCC